MKRNKSAKQSVLLKAHGLLNVYKLFSRLLKDILCYIVYFSGLYLLLDKIYSEKGVYIIMYHRLAEADRETGELPFLAVDWHDAERQLGYFFGKYEILPVSEAAKKLKEASKLKKNYMAITFDDGYRDNYIYGDAIFRKFGISPTIYVTAGNIESQTYLPADYIVQSAWLCKVANISINEELFTRGDAIRFLLQRLRKLEGSEVKEYVYSFLPKILGTSLTLECDLMLSWDEINKLAEAGAEIGGHTMTHPALDRLSPADVASELVCSKELTEKRTGRPVKSFSYPYGIYNSEVRAEVMRYYESAVTTRTGVNYPGTDIYLIKRIGIEPGISLTHLKLRLLRIRIRSRYT